MLTLGGVNAVVFRDLAEGAGVTVPTIYNLVGGKEEVLVALFADIIADLEARIDTTSQAEPLAVAEALVVQTAEIFAADEAYYRSAFLAVEHIHRLRVRQPSVTRLYFWGDHLLGAGVAACGASGLLRGDVAPEALAGVVKRAFRENLFDWAFGETSIAQFRDTALTDIYLALAADAGEALRPQLIHKIGRLKPTASCSVAEAA